MFSHYFFQIFFLPLSISPLSGTPIVYVGILGGVIGLLGSFHFLISSFFFLLRLDNFKWPIFKFSDSFLCLLKCAFETLTWIFHFSYIFQCLLIVFWWRASLASTSYSICNCALVFTFCLCWAWRSTRGGSSVYFQVSELESFREHLHDFLKSIVYVVLFNALIFQETAFLAFFPRLMLFHCLPHL